MTMHKPPRCAIHTKAFQAGCPACQARSNWHGRLRKGLIRIGAWDGIQDPAAVREHLTKLTRGGMTLRQIEERSGVSMRVLTRVANGHVGGCRADIADAILGVTHDLSDMSLIPGAGTSRRIRALMWNGRTLQWIADHAPVAFHAARRIASDETRQVRRQTADRVTVLFDRWALVRVSATREERNAHKHAVRHGWHSAMAWWDDIDNPAAKPNLGTDDEVACEETVQRALSGAVNWRALNAADRLALLDQARSSGVSRLALANRTGVSESTVQQWYSRAMRRLNGQVAA